MYVIEIGDVMRICRGNGWVPEDAIKNPQSQIAVRVFG